MANDGWLSAKEAARYLNIHERTIYDLIAAGKLEAIHAPVRIKRSALDACVTACRIKPGELAHLNQYASGRYRYSAAVRHPAG